MKERYREVTVAAVLQLFLSLIISILVAADTLHE